MVCFKRRYQSVNRNLMNVLNETAFEWRFFKCKSTSTLNKSSACRIFVSGVACNWNWNLIRFLWSNWSFFGMGEGLKIAYNQKSLIYDCSFTFSLVRFKLLSIFGNLRFEKNRWVFAFFSLLFRFSYSSSLFSYSAIAWGIKWSWSLLQL